MRIDLQRAGGIAAIVEAVTYVIGFVLLLGVLVPAGYEPGGANPENVAFAIGNQTTLYLFNLIIYVINGAFLVILSIALYERLKVAAPALAATAGAFGLIWAGYVLASGMIANIGLGAVADLYGETPARASDLYLMLATLGEGLGGGNEVTGGIWVALISLAGLRTRLLPMPLNILGVVAGLAGVFSVIPALAEMLTSIFGLGLIVWFAWAGIVLLAGARQERT